MPAPDRPEDIIARCYQSLALRPDDPVVHVTLGSALWTTGAREEAIGHFARAVELDPGYVDARDGYGNALSRSGRFAEAVAQFRAAVALRPEEGELHYHLGNALLGSGEPVEAEACYHDALARRPDHAGALNNLGNAMRSQQRYAEAIPFYRRALALRPEYFGTRNNIGSALLALHRPAEAIPYFQAALAARPDYAEACNNLGGAKLALGHPAEAVAWFRRAVELDPDQVQAQLGEALALLSMGNFRRGWAVYEARWRMPQFRADVPALADLHWDGAAEVSGRTILLYAEQGLGDTIQFVRYAKRLRARGARVVLSVQPSLVRLFAGLGDAVIAQTDALPPHELHCPLMSLPLAFGTELATIPAEIPYLQADAALVAAWAERLGMQRRRRIGVAWSGSAEHPEDALRSIPLAAFLAALEGANCDLHILQTEISSEDGALLEGMAGIGVHRDRLTDFAETAALIACLDLVISVDTSVAHLAGAMGVPVWVLVQSSADFRWLRDRADSPWYPTMRIFRQRTLLEWAPVLAEVRAALTGS
ncbi:MAG TPA: tetratricopeptide repeat protein [Acetobacteraceae bacterium]|jgi:tetratricopeptide (TPR) repeat protein